MKTLSSFAFVILIHTTITVCISCYKQESNAIELASIPNRIVNAPTLEMIEHDEYVSFDGDYPASWPAELKFLDKTKVFNNGSILRKHSKRRGPYYVVKCLTYLSEQDILDLTSILNSHKHRNERSVIMDKSKLKEITTVNYQKYVNDTLYIDLLISTTENDDSYRIVKITLRPR